MCRASDPRAGWRKLGPVRVIPCQSPHLSIAVMGAAHKLPPPFTSSYRLFLRASSASVLHHRAATRYVRTLWKPTFREAAVVIHKLQSPTLGISEKEQLEKWRCLWELNSAFQGSYVGPSRQKLIFWLKWTGPSRCLSHRLNLEVLRMD
jgi:hypothetical protein